MNLAARHFDQELSHLKDKIQEMGGYVEKAIENAIEALLKREPQRLQVVYKVEKKIDECHLLIDDMCLKMLARQAPMANDLRIILATIKINTDLERMGDQAVNIAQNSDFYLKESESLDPLPEIQEMTTEVQKMVRSCLDAFIHLDVSTANRVIDHDRVVNELKSQIFDKLIEQTKDQPNSVKRCLDLILIARNLERLGDHATNIAEDTIFAASGKDVRHPSVRIQNGGS